MYWQFGLVYIYQDIAILKDGIGCRVFVNVYALFIAKDLQMILSRVDFYFQDFIRTSV